jgi:hypothetical protein
MQSILLLRLDELKFEPAVVEKTMRTVKGFGKVRLDDPAGALNEAEYVGAQGRTVVTLSESARAISLSGTGDAALHAALVLQGHLTIPLRIVDTEYSFDLDLSSFFTLDELSAAIDQARDR